MRQILPALLGAIASAALSATGQAPAEGLLDLREIAAWLPGDYDNEPQRFFLDGMKRAAEAPSRQHLTVTRISATGLDIVLQAAQRDGSEHSVIARRAIWRLSVNPTTHAVEMRASSANAQGQEITDGAVCVMVWTRRVGVFVGDVMGVCPPALAHALMLPGATQMWLAAEELWRADADAAVPNQFFKSQQFECFLALRLRNGEPQAFNGLALHDRGGTVEVTTSDTPARKLTLLLRRGLWPSNSGSNFVQLMNLYLSEEGRRNFVGNGWATPESGRVGFGVGDELPGGQAASARCKRVSAAGAN